MLVDILKPKFLLIQSSFYMKVCFLSSNEAYLAVLRLLYDTLYILRYDCIIKALQKAFLTNILSSNILSLDINGKRENFMLNLNQ